MRARGAMSFCFGLCLACDPEGTVNPGGADQCEVFAVGAGDEPLGIVYVNDAEVYLRGGYSSRSAYLHETGGVLLQRDGDWVTAGTYDGQVVTIPASDGTWTSKPVGPRQAALENGELLMRFGWRGPCSPRDVAAGLVQSFELVHAASGPVGPQF